MAGAILTLAWLGAVPNLPVNHEIMHRRNVMSRYLTRFTGAFYGDPFRDIAHVHGHHLHLGTVLDGDTARRGDTIYNFAPRAARDAISDAWRVECARLEKRSLPRWSFHNAILQGYAGLAALVVATGLLGGVVAGVTLGLGIVASRLLVEAFNYYQHYGIVRVVDSPYGRRHLWNHLTPVSRALGFEITNHADHHMDPYMPFYKLSPQTDGPQMPSIFVCFLSGIIPPIWFHFIAKPHLKDWDLRFASLDERRLAAEANRRAGWPDWLGEDRANPAFDSRSVAL
jgi:fatty acid desaturase